MRHWTLHAATIAVVLTGAQAALAEQKTVGLAVATLQQNFFNQIKQAVEEQGESKDVAIITVDAGGDPARQVSQVQDLIAVYRDLARRCDYALHLGLTEAGMGTKGIVASSAAMGILLQEGIGDTIRVSLTPEPGGDRTREVQVAQELLQTMGFRQFLPVVAACPGCGRTTSTVFQELAEAIQSDIRTNMPIWREKYPGVEALNVAVMGCIVNGPGEMADADFGYVGCGPGRVNLYVGSDVVVRNVPQDEAPDRLLEVIDERWDGDGVSSS